MQDANEPQTPPNKYIQIKFMSATTPTPTFFRVKTTLPFSKIFNAYESKLGAANGNFKYMLNGEIVTPDHTPGMLEMEDDDQIDVMRYQTGGK